MAARETGKNRGRILLLKIREIIGRDCSRYRVLNVHLEMGFWSFRRALVASMERGRLVELGA